MKKIIAVTGSKGFIGTHLVKVLIKNNFKIIELNKQDGYDVSDISTLSKVNQFDTIVHLSDCTFIPDSFKNPSNFFNNNFLCMLNVLELARQFSANVIFFSSYLYGHPKYFPINEKHPIQPHNPYAQSKLISEKLCEGYPDDRFNRSSSYEFLKTEGKVDIHRDPVRLAVLTIPLLNKGNNKLEFWNEKETKIVKELEYGYKTYIMRTKIPHSVSSSKKPRVFWQGSIFTRDYNQVQKDYRQDKIFQ